MHLKGTTQRAFLQIIEKNMKYSFSFYLR